MDHDTFKISFITPALLSGADPGKADQTGLRGSSLRGMWRFWARALWCGLNKQLMDDGHSALRKLEDGLFGSTENRGFRMKIHPESLQFRKARPVPHDKRIAIQDAIAEGACFKVILYWPVKWNQEDIRRSALSSIIMLWSILGSIGQRSRRGFGSVRLHEGTGPFNWGQLLKYESAGFPEKFIGSAALENFIKTAIREIVKIQIGYMVSQGIDAPDRDIDSPLGDAIFKEMFVLSSLDQIAAGKDLPDELFGRRHPDRPDREGVLFKTHGVKAAKDEKGKAVPPPRLASPIYVRLHQSQNGYIPLAVMSYRKESGKFTPAFKRWLQEMGVEKLMKEEVPKAD